MVTAHAKQHVPATRAKVDGYRLEQLLGHSFFHADPSAPPPTEPAFSVLRNGLAWWHGFACDVITEYRRQQADHAPTKYLWASDAAFSNRVAQWTLHAQQEIAWRTSPAIVRGLELRAAGRLEDDSPDPFASRPTKPLVDAPQWERSPIGWPPAVTCEDVVGRFFASRMATHAEQQRDAAAAAARV